MVYFLDQENIDITDNLYDLATMPNSTQGIHQIAWLNDWLVFRLPVNFSFAADTSLVKRATIEN